VPPTRSYDTPAIVIRARPFGETSQVVQLATPNHGLVAAMVKGAHRPGPEFQGGLALCTLGTARLRHRRGAEMDLLQRFRLTEDLRGLRTHLGRYYGACYVVELLRAWMQPALPSPALHGAAVTALRALAGTSQASLDAWIVWFEARALAAGGHRPRLEACALCDGALEADILFSPEAGGLVHPRCAPAGPTRRLDPLACAGLQRVYTARLPELRDEPLSQTAVAAARSVHDLFVPYVLERRPKALAPMRQNTVSRS
jgi:DNA repair protein RecO (recombination protein O)